MQEKGVDLVAVGGGHQGGKAALPQHGGSGVAEGGMGEAGDLAAGGDAADADCRKFGNSELLERPGGEGVYRLGDGGEDLTSSALPGGTGM